MKGNIIKGYFQVILLFYAILIAPFMAQAEDAQGVITLPATGQTGTYGINDDGALHKGAVWPDPRFTDNKNDTITDNLTGLLWTRNARNPGPLACPMDKNTKWEDALAHVACMNAHKYLGYDDWRMPNVNELASLIDTDYADSSVWLTSQGFKNIMMEFYWTSTTNADSKGEAWVGVMYSGNLFCRSKGKKYPLWPVRGGKDISSGIIQLPETGQNKCYEKKYRNNSDPCKGSGEDGEFTTGAAWPNPRFRTEGDVVVDKLTGLTWAKTPYKKNTWAGALDFVKDLSLGGHDDWRLPNRNELRSLVNYGEDDPADWLNTQGFNKVRSDDYWTSSAYEDRLGNSWVVNLEYGYVVAGRKDKKYYIFPVRGGR